MLDALDWVLQSEAETRATLKLPLQMNRSLILAIFFVRSKFLGLKIFFGYGEFKQLRGKRKNDLIDLALKSQEIKVAKVSEVEEPESIASIIKGQLMTKEEGILTNPLETNHVWTNNLF